MTTTEIDEPRSGTSRQRGGDAVTQKRDDTARFARLVGGAALSFSVLYFVSDLIEFAQGGFSTPQLALTYAAEAAIPIFILGLFAMQRPRIGALGLVGAVTYAYTFVFFTSTVVYALVNHTRDWTVLTTQLGGWVAVHSVLMVFAGVMFGVAVIQANVLPRWTGIALIVGMVLMAVTASLPEPTQIMSAAVRDLALAGMGAALLQRTTGSDSAHEEHRSSAWSRTGASR
ncbi:MAG: hypothetical protein QOI95_4374 [Acidimicrobiaceae bacterium]|jgi:membrane protein implicated in regulation of membrane protease activity